MQIRWIPKILVTAWLLMGTIAPLTAAPSAHGELLAAQAPVLTAGANSAWVEAGSQGDAHASEESHGITHRMMILVLQLAIIIIAARLGGELFERFLKQPAVLGELTAGMVIGPYALGPYIGLFGSGALFPLLEGNSLPVSGELYGVATIASIILLFMVGLETDFHKFMRFVGPGFAVGVGGVLGSFITGDLLYVWYSGESFMSPAALFMGTVSTATSVGITARVLSEKKKLDSPEGTTILAGAVIDDVLGILILAIVGGVAAAEASAGQEVNWSQIGIVAVKAFGFWLGATAIGILLSGRIARFMLGFKTAGSRISLGLGLALLLAGIAETFGLAMIIGAYIMGLSLSKEEVSHHLERRLTPLYACLVPVFFAVMGMLVNFEAILGKAMVFGLIYSAVAIVAKVLGSALPCFFVGFNALGSTRIGIGMLPRGEVALIVAGVGMSYGYVGQDMFGVVIMMTLITTMIAPPVLVWLFGIPKEGTKEPSEPIVVPEKLLILRAKTWPDHNFFISCLKQALSDRDFTFRMVSADSGIYHIHGKVDGEQVNVTMEDKSDRILLNTSDKHYGLMKQVVEQAHEEAKRRIADLDIEEKTLGGAST